MEVRAIPFTAIVLLFFFLTGFRSQAGRVETAGPWFSNAQMTRLYESLIAFHQSGIFAPDRLQADSEVLAAYLGRHDPYARLYTASEYAAFRQSLSPEYGGVEMEISLTEATPSSVRPTLAAPPRLPASGRETSFWPWTAETRT